MGVGAKELACFLYSSPKCADRHVREPLIMELIHREAMGQHVDDLDNSDTSAFNCEFTACALRTLVKVFHSISNSSKRSEKSQIWQRFT
jgi:hypothetical protein